MKIHESCGRYRVGGGWTIRFSRDGGGLLRSANGPVWVLSPEQLSRMAEIFISRKKKSAATLPQFPSHSDE